MKLKKGKQEVKLIGTRNIPSGASVRGSKFIDRLTWAVAGTDDSVRFYRRFAREDGTHRDMKRFLDQAIDHCSGFWCDELYIDLNVLDTLASTMRKHPALRRMCAEMYQSLIAEKVRTFTVTG
jgi:hypothetical protein